MQRWRKGREGGGKRAEEGGGKSVNKGWRRRGGETHMLRKEALQN